LTSEVLVMKKDMKSESESVDGSALALNVVRIAGRISATPEERTLPSGDSVWTFRLVVARPEGHAGRQRVDTLECAVWGGRVRKQVTSWQVGDIVEVSGSLRRRFFATGTGRASRVEVEVAAGKMLKRATVRRAADR
jgi:single-strand DNA-binding protein